MIIHCIHVLTNKIDIIFFIFIVNEMYLKNVSCVENGSYIQAIRQLNYKNIPFDKYYNIVALYKFYTYDFNSSLEWRGNMEYIEVYNKSMEITNKILNKYIMHILLNDKNSNEHSLYRIPRTFTIAYNETHLISTSMRANLHYLHWLLQNMNCIDIITHISSHLFAHCQYDYSLYICAN